MKRFSILLLLVLNVVIMMAQKPLAFEKVINADGQTAKQLFDKVKSWSSKEFEVGTYTANEDSENLEISGKGKMVLTTNVVYSSIKGHIEYLINIQFKDNKIKLTMSNFTHKPAIIANYNNDMGILVDELPKNLSDIGIDGAGRKASYKYYYKNGKPLCEKKFESIVTSLTNYLTTSENKEDW